MGEFGPGDALSPTADAPPPPAPEPYVPGPQGVLPPLFPCDGAGVAVSTTLFPVPQEFGPRLSPAAPPPDPPGEPSLVGAFSDAPP